MKKTTFNTLLCTTILVPGLSMAAEQLRENPLSTPARKGAFTRLQQDISVATPTREADTKKREVEKGIESTPQMLQRIKAFYQEASFSEVEIEEFAQKDLETAKVDRERLKRDAFRQIEQEKTQELLRRKLALEENKRQQTQIEQEALIAKVESQSSQGLELLQLEVSTLKSENSELAELLEKTDSDKRQLTEQLESLKKQVEELSENINALEGEKSDLEIQLGEDIKNLKEEHKKLQTNKDVLTKLLDNRRSEYESRVAELNKSEDEKLLAQLEMLKIEAESAILGKERLETWLRKKSQDSGSQKQLSSSRLSAPIPFALPSPTEEKVAPVEAQNPVEAKKPVEKDKPKSLADADDEL